MIEVLGRFSRTGKRGQINTNIIASKMKSNLRLNDYTQEIRSGSRLS